MGKKSPTTNGKIRNEIHRLFLVPNGECFHQSGFLEVFLLNLSASTPANGEKIINAVTRKVSAAASITAARSSPNGSQQSQSDPCKCITWQTYGPGHVQFGEQCIAQCLKRLR